MQIQKGNLGYSELSSSPPHALIVVARADHLIAKQFNPKQNTMMMPLTFKQLIPLTYPR